MHASARLVDSLIRDFASAFVAEPLRRDKPRLLTALRSSTSLRSTRARKLLLDESAPRSALRRKRAGTRHLLGRKVFAAAAMLGLVGILTAVVYTIVAPETVMQGPVAVERRELPPLLLSQESAGVKPAPTIVAAPFSGRLELRIRLRRTVVAFINRAIEDNVPSDEWIASDQSNVKEPHALICSSESFNLLLAELGNIWDKLDSAHFFVDTQVFGEQVVVDAVTVEQILGIVNQDDSKRRMEVAKDFAVLNNMAEHFPGTRVLTAIDDTTVGLITPPKPVLTWNQKTEKKSPARTKENKNIHLTITVVGGN